MRNESGGSSHDPSTQLPPPAWDREVEVTLTQCGLCRSGPREEKAKVFKHRIRVTKGPAPGDFLLCRRCDGGPRPPADLPRPTT